MRWYRRILGAVLLVVILFLVVGFFLPAEYHVERSVVIAASPLQIHPFTSDLRMWEEWTPWQREDESLVIEYGARTSGVGARQSWTSENGRGTLVVTSSDPDRGVELDFRLGDQSHLGAVVLRYAPVDGGTRVFMTMDGEVGATPIERWFSAFMGVMTGPDFERALSRLRVMVEASRSS